MNAPAAIHNFTDPSTNRQFIGRVLRGLVLKGLGGFRPGLENRASGPPAGCWRKTETSRWIRNRDGSGIVSSMTGTGVYGFTKEETRPEESGP
jgi:hypothetical protein